MDYRPMGKRDRYDTSKHPTLSNAARARIADFELGAYLFEKDNPNMNTGVLSRFLVGYRQVEEENARLVADFNQDNRQLRNQRSPVGLNPADLRRATHQNIASYFAEFSRTVKPEEKEVWEKFAKKMQPKSLITAATGQFYESDKGLHIFGIAGGLAGGYYIFNQMGGLQGGWMAVGAGLLASIAGAWLSNNVADKIAGFFSGDKSKEPPKITVPERQRSASKQGPQEGLETERLPRKRMGELVESIVMPYRADSNPTDVAISDTNMSPSGTPLARADDKIKNKAAANPTIG